MSLALGEGARQVAGAASQISRSAQSVAQGSSEQAREIEQVAKAIMQMEGDPDHSGQGRGKRLGQRRVEREIGDAGERCGAAREQALDLGASASKGRELSSVQCCHSTASRRRVVSLVRYPTGPDLPVVGNLFDPQFAGKGKMYVLARILTIVRLKKRAPSTENE
jgi:hypothetical protein